MRVGDTSILYALFSENDIYHEKAVHEVKNPEIIFIPSEIWSETISLIHYRQGVTMAVKAGKALLDLPHVELLGSRIDIIHSSWNQYQKMGDLSFPDCIVLEWCKEKNAIPLTCATSIKRSFEKNSL